MFAPASWQTFLDHSLATRLDPETFESYVQILSSKQPLSASLISDIFLRPTECNTVALDPRIPRYVQILLSLELVTVPSLLRALLRYSTSIQEQENETQEGDKKKVKRWSNSTASEETLFYRLAKTISSATAPRTMQEAVELMRVCIQWMETGLAASNAAQGMLEPGKTEEMNAHTMALGTLVVAAVENAQVITVLGKASAPKGMGKELSKTLGVFVPLLLHTSPQSAARLELFRTQTLVAVEPVDKKDVEANKEIDDLLDQGMGIDSVVVVELPTMNSRAGLYVYLNSLVCIRRKLALKYILTIIQLVARPLIDDSAIFSYLNNRYQVNIHVGV
jgi:mediator of RNA polymerase II transcription subunit 5